ncbi:MAG: ABC transporter ATP-binding protein [Bacillota bacterium]
MKYLFHYIEKKKLIAAFSLITLQQTLNALGTYALAKAGLSFENRERFIFWILSSLLLFIFSPLTNVFIRRLESELSFSAYKIFLKESLFSKSGKPTLWQNKSLKDSFLASIGSDASDYLGLVLFISLDIYSFILSVILSVLALSFTIDMSLLPAFITSGVLSFFVYRTFSAKVEDLCNIEQKARTSLIGHLLKSWDNVFLKNYGILSTYQSVFEQKFSTTQAQAKKSAAASELLIFALGVTTGIPVLVSIIWILIHSSTNTQVLVALLATLPRQLNILSVFRNIFQSLTSLLSVEAKFETLKQGTIIPERVLATSIKSNLMMINHAPVVDLDSLITQISESANGRFEVRGPNGAGKSTLLLHLNHKLIESVYLPTHPDLMIDDRPMLPRSSGENLLAHIDTLSKSSEPIILLDEWDANLDEENLRQVNARIEELAKFKTVVEVRHR